jgi:hypothetical protein
MIASRGQGVLCLLSFPLAQGGHLEDFVAITNGYCSLEELKQRWAKTHTYAASTISFGETGAIIADSAKGLKRFAVKGGVELLLKIEGSSLNTGVYTVQSGGTSSQITVSGTLATEAAGAEITLTDVTQPEEDAALESVVEAASRAIDNELGRRFCTTNSDEERYFTPEFYDLLFPGDVVSVTKIETDDNLDRTYSGLWTGGSGWTGVSDFELAPYNAPLEGRPYTKIETSPVGSRSFDPGARRSVKITGKFGYSTTAPANIKEAALLAAEKLFGRKDIALYGVQASGDALRQIVRDDPDIQMLLQGMYKGI